MTDRLYRASPTDLSVRSDGRTIYGIAMPFDTVTNITEPNGYRFDEVFRRGAFERTITERGPRSVKAFAQHQRGNLPIGRAETLREDAAGLYAELRVSKTREGDEVLELVRDGALDALSIGFAPVRDRRADNGTVERLEVKLLEISAVSHPAYDDARIVGVRSAPEDALQVRQALLTTLERYDLQ